MVRRGEHVREHDAGGAPFSLASEDRAECYAPAVMRPLVLVTLVLLVSACATARDSFTVSNVNGCLQKQCAGSGDPTDRASCEASCRRTYGH